jgi:histidine triad (HIT) family protein
MADCLFCKIVSGAIPAKIIHQADLVLAFEDIRPQAPHHVLIIPKAHYASLEDVPDGEAGLLAEVLLAARAIARERGIAGGGYRIVLNTGRDSGQEVFHIHFHLLGGRRLGWPPG